MKERLINAQQSHLMGHINKHLANIEVLLNNPVGIGEHPDVMESLEKEIEQIAHYDDLLNALQKYLQ